MQTESISGEKKLGSSEAGAARSQTEGTGFEDQGDRARSQLNSADPFETDKQQGRATLTEIPNETLTEALRLAELGYRVMPCIPNDKRPLSANGLKDATTDEFQIHSWFVDNPTANLAVATDGLIVIDRDTDKETGAKNSDFSPDQELELAAGPHSLTANGGDHNWFRQRPERPRRNNTKKLGPQTDTRASGGYVLVYPSVVDGKPYTWQADNGLDVGPDQLSFAPDWLEAGLDEQKPNVTDSPNGQTSGVSEGGRNAYLTQIGGGLRRSGLDEGEILAALLVRNQKNQPPLDETEVRQVARSVARYVPDQIATLVMEGAGASQLIVPKTPATLETLTSLELDEGYFPIEYLIPGILVADQPCILAGPKKNLKTSVLIALTLSLASMGKFLGEFYVNKPIRVALISGESGKATIQETARRIAKTMPWIHLRDYENAFWCFDLPKLGQPGTLQFLVDYIKLHSLQLLVIDPAYLCLPIGDGASNQFIVGPMLQPLAEAMKLTGCTIIICCHTRKNMIKQFDPPEIDSIAWAGFGDWMRQWILLGRRKAFKPDGDGLHELWLSTGGSAGHGGLWALDVIEGTQQDPGGRRWDVNVRKASEAQREEIEERTEKRQEREKTTLDKNREKVLEAYQGFPNGETMNALRNAAGMSGKTFDPINRRLVQDGLVEACDVLKTGRKTPSAGFRLRQSDNADNSLSV